VWVELPGRDAERLIRVVASQDSELRGHILRMVPIEVGPDESDAYQAAHSWECRTLAVFEDGELSPECRGPLPAGPAGCGRVGARGGVVIFHGRCLFC
jgi:hypothetical protein